jgi:hypothetical protein
MMLDGTGAGQKAGPYVPRDVRSLAPACTGFHAREIKEGGNDDQD